MTPPADRPAPQAERCRCQRCDRRATRSVRWQSNAMPAPAFWYLCARCADETTRWFAERPAALMLTYSVRQLTVPRKRKEAA